MLVPPEGSSAVLVMIRSKSMSICNHSRARLVDSSRNRTFSWGYLNLMRSYRGLLEPRGSNLTPLKSTFNAEHFICRLSWYISSNFNLIHSWNMCHSLKLRKNTKNPIFRVQGPRCWYPWKSCQHCLLCMMRSTSVSICNHSHARRTNSGKITIS